MPDYGMKGSAPGYEVTDVIDYLAQFNSSWPLLKISHTGTFGGPISHNLGYPPFHFIARSDGRIDQFAGSGVTSYGVDEFVLDRTAASSADRYFISPLPLTVNFNASNIPGSVTKTTLEHDFGFKVSKPGKDISSTDLRDFALHSSTRSLMVDRVDFGVMVNTGGGLGYERTVAHGLGYAPIAFVFIKPGTNILSMSTTRYAIVPTAVGVSGMYYSADSTNVYVTADPTYFTGGAPTISVVILKDPFNKDSINITFP